MNSMCFPPKSICLHLVYQTIVYTLLSEGSSATVSNRSPQPTQSKRFSSALGYQGCRRCCSCRVEVSSSGVPSLCCFRLTGELVEIHGDIEARLCHGADHLWDVLNQSFLHCLEYSETLLLVECRPQRIIHVPSGFSY